LPSASQKKVSRNFYWIWFVGAAAWFLDAALSLHHHALASGLVAAAVWAMFLAAGMYFRKQAKRGDKL
jgi:Flp pilus assembly protein TadB